MNDLTLGASRIEALADTARERSALGGFNLASARHELKQLLEGIGRTQEFSTYTRHDITHIDALLQSTDWIIPERTWAELTVADALVITLSIYLHDLGMLVTKDEFAAREESEFPEFRERILSDQGPRGVDFRDRLDALEGRDREHFLYEEFVRVHHAERIEAWVLGKGHERFGISKAAVGIVDSVLSKLDEVIRADIALVARSHHLDDLDDTDKYQVRRSYGSDRQDEANLQYAAVILRTADLLHMSRDRTPTIQYQLASPADPLGQREWRKQRAVRAVKPQPTRSGEPAKIGVHARFDEPEGYFALMEYLDYCDVQLQQSAKWVKDAREEHVSCPEGFEFPWRFVDRDQIEAVGFNRHHFSFTFDQAKVLELLTGHTLYNDASVAIREIVQNAIDAVRLQQSILPSLDDSPDVFVGYRTADRMLRVRDRGTGMTQETLTDHFLKVGSSGYQTDQFKERHPMFSPISRFGIGVLSAFMIADEVRVATIDSGESVGRELVLKSVHGRYLIRELDPSSEVAQRLGSHGTEIEMKLRASSGLEGSVIGLLRKWILQPRCNVVAQENDDDAVVVGWASTKDALEGLLDLAFSETQQRRVVEKKVGPATIAIAEVWNPAYREWEVVRPGKAADPFHDEPESDGPEARLDLTGVSVQGIRVTSELPGWRDSAPVMLVDVSGAAAPRTNVARTDLEAGEQLDTLIEAIYAALLGSIEDQIPEISSHVSMRLALKEARYLYRAATSGERVRAYTKPRAMRRVLSQAPLHPVEQDSVLNRVSVETLRDEGFRLLVGPAADDAARFLDWLPQPKGLMTVLRDGGLLSDVDEDTSLPLLGGQDSLFGYDELLWDLFDVSAVRSLEGGRSLLITFLPTSGRWGSERPYTSAFIAAHRALSQGIDRQRSGGYGRYESRYCLDGSVEMEELPESADIVFIGGYRMFGPNSPFVREFVEINQRAESGQEAQSAVEAATLSTIAARIGPSKWGNGDYEDFVSAIDAWLGLPGNAGLPARDSLLELARMVGSVPVWSASSAWQRRGDSTMFG